MAWGRRWLGLLLAVLLAALLTGCGGQPPALPRLGPQDVLLAFGDSLTHGTGAAPGQSYPDQLGALIGRPVVNAGVPGETTEQGLLRLPGVLQNHAPRILLLCLGGNDFLRGGGARAEANLAAMIELARGQGVAVVLIGVPEPRLLGGVADLYPRLAERFSLHFEGEVMNRVLRQAALKADPVHPNAQGYALIAQSLARLLREAGAL